MIRQGAGWRHHDTDAISRWIPVGHATLANIFSGSFYSIWPTPASNFAAIFLWGVWAYFFSIDRAASMRAFQICLDRILIRTRRRVMAVWSVGAGRMIRAWMWPVLPLQVMMTPPHRWYVLLWSVSRRSYLANAAILGDFEVFWTLSYPSDGGSAALIAICHCGDDPESYFMVLDRFLSNEGGLARRRSKVTADFGFWSFFMRWITHDWRISQ